MKHIYYLVLLSFFLISSSQSFAQWGDTTTFPGEERDGAFSAVVAGRIFVGGGILSKDMYEFLPATKTWAKRADVAGGNNLCFAGSFVINGKIYTVGGDPAFGTAHNQVWCYEPTGNSWSQKNNFMGGNRVGLVCMVIGSRVFVGGGTDNFGGAGYGTIKKDFYEYNVTADSWTATTDLPAELAFASAFVIGNKGYVVCGEDKTHIQSKKLYIFDPATGWSTGTDFMGAARNAGTAFALNGMGYMGLGQADLSTNFVDMYEYNPTGNSWKKLGDYPLITSGWATAFVNGNEAYVGTGTDVNTLDLSKTFYKFSATATGIASVKNAGVVVYPNPFTNTVTISSEVNSVEITDISGKIIANYSFRNIGGQTQLNLERLSNGVYFLHINENCVKLIKE